MDTFKQDIKKAFNVNDKEINFSFSLDNKSCDIQSFLKLYKIESIEFSKPHLKLCRSLNIESDEKIWLTTPKHIREKWIDDLASKFNSLIKANQELEYFKKFVTIRKFINSMEPYKFSRQKINMLQAKYSSAAYNKLDHFKNLNYTTKHKVNYCNVSTATGRLKVINGPNFLNLPSNFKYALKSSFKGGSILQIDLIAAEPSLLLRISKNKEIEDPYLYVSENLFNEKHDRETTKSIVLCMLYGQSSSKLQERLNLKDKIEAENLIEETRNFFGVDKLLDNISEDIIFKNYFGRPFYLAENNKNLLLNYYIQSSAAEASILAFKNFIDATKRFCKPIIIIHDALIIDASEEFANYVLNKKQLNIPLEKWKLSASVENFNINDLKG